MFQLGELTALVTGASGGIGAAIAKALDAQGARVAISGTKKENLEKLAKELKNDPVILPCNLKSNEEVEQLIPQAEQALGKVDILVNNAGLTKDNLLIRLKDEDWDEVIAVNLTSCFRLTRAAIKGMMKRNYGRIINMSSVVAEAGNVAQANYCASKAGMIGFTKSVATEYAKKGVTANCVAPGFIDTSMTSVLHDQVKESLLNNIPLKRMGTPEEIASIVAFLASREASYITGQTLHVNGGMYMA